ncbi:MAG: hypothetical protein LH702_10235 [Phormidesmis sp. CAN_BIN44]|nr:hypothetical protein [Phormidesmis sp. CAN_BIN44]
MSRSKELYRRMIQACMITGSIVKPDMAKPIGTKARSTIELPRARRGDVQCAMTLCLTEKRCKLITECQ